MPREWYDDPKRCAERVYHRDTYRYTGRGKGGFEMHYTRKQCARKATVGDYCWQHAPWHRHEGKPLIDVLAEEANEG